MIWPDLNPISFSIDFKRAAINAICASLSEASLHEYLFPLVKNIRAKLADQPWIYRYKTYPNFSVNTSMNVAISFVPPNIINTSLAAISASFGGPIVNL
ncbi:hypothetical protein MXB_1584 [Myxobolus squamalis]|nr:hypothetical protein MXB_1584 [Myxobolus squamalis]